MARLLFYFIIHCFFDCMASRLTFWTYHILYFLLIALYVWSLYLKIYAPNKSFSNHYLADLICMPLVFYLVEAIFKVLKIKFILSITKIIFGVLYFSFLFEFLLPKLSEKYTADWIDVLMYCCGGFLCFLSIKVLKPKNSNYFFTSRNKSYD